MLLMSLDSLRHISQSLDPSTSLHVDAAGMIPATPHGFCDQGAAYPSKPLKPQSMKAHNAKR